MPLFITPKPDNFEYNTLSVQYLSKLTWFKVDYKKHINPLKAEYLTKVSSYSNYYMNVKIRDNLSIDIEFYSNSQMDNTYTYHSSHYLVIGCFGLDGNAETLVFAKSHAVSSSFFNHLGSDKVSTTLESDGAFSVMRLDSGKPLLIDLTVPENKDHTVIKELYAKLVAA